MTVAVQWWFRNHQLPVAVKVQMVQVGWVNAAGAGSTTATYTPSSATPGTTYYRVLVNAANNDCEQAVSNNAVAIIIPDFVVTAQPTNVNECVGGTNQMTVASKWWFRNYHLSVAVKCRRIQPAGQMQQEQEQQQQLILHQVQYQEQPTTEY